MNNETVIEELAAHRGFLLTNTWVPHAPTDVGEGCLMLGVSHFATCSYSLSAEARMFVRLVLASSGPPSSVSLGQWNDNECRSAGEAIAVLEEAIILAKRDLP